MLPDGSKLHKQNLSRTVTKSVLLAILYLALWRAPLKPGNQKPESINQRKQVFHMRENYFA